MNRLNNEVAPPSAFPRSTIVVSVVIPAYNEERLIAAAIASVFQSRSELVANKQVEVIVVDNASTDNTAAIAARAGARVIPEPKRQISRARNVGAHAAQGRYLIFLDADSELHPDQLQRVADLLGSGKVIGGGAPLSMDGPWDCRLLVAAWNRISIWGRLAAGSFFFCEREAFEKVGGFDETLYASEELKLSYRLRGLSREQAKKFVIISDLPIKTSNRKVIDHTRAELWSWLLRLAFRGRSGLRDQEACQFWYPQTRR